MYVCIRLCVFLSLLLWLLLIVERHITWSWAMIIWHIPLSIFPSYCLNCTTQTWIHHPRTIVLVNNIQLDIFKGIKFRAFANVICGIAEKRKLESKTLSYYNSARPKRIVVVVVGCGGGGGGSGIGAHVIIKIWFSKNQWNREFNIYSHHYIRRSET